MLNGVKMKKITKVCLIAATLLLLSSPGFAKNDNNNVSAELPNGRPFQILQSQIDQNNAVIAANANNIFELQATTRQIQNEINVINMDITYLEQNIQSNVDSIGVLNNQMAEVQTNLDLSQQQIADIRDGMLQMQAQHQAEIALLSGQIATYQDEINELRQQVNSSVATLSDQLATLQIAVNANSSDISGLLAPVTSLMAQIITMNVTLDNHENRLDFLESSVVGINAMLASVTAAIANLETRLAVVEKEVFPSTLITTEGEAYGHHGQCSGWNGCGDAATCAQWACEVNGYSSLISYGEDKPCTEFDNCHLFRSRGIIDWNWGNRCGVRGVTDIVCN